MIKITDPILGSTKLGAHTVPYVWTYMLPEEVFKLQIPEELQSTCMSCPKVASDNWRADYRCCTYHPYVPNFMLGLALFSKESKSIVEPFIEAGFALPEGSVLTPSRWYEYLKDAKQEKFGKSKRTLCHFLNTDNGYCQIYNFRNSVCSTFFCRHDHGDRGSKFWDDVQSAVSQTETALSQWALEEIGFDVKRMIKTMDNLSEEIEDAARKNMAWKKSWLKAIFADWYEHRLELFKKTALVIADNRDNLWELAGKHTIHEARKFESSQIDSVPKKLRSEVDPGDYNEGEHLTPAELFEDVFTSEAKLWHIPSKPLRLNPRVVIQNNPLKYPEDKHSESLPYALDMNTNKKHEEFEWREYMGDYEKNLLEHFRIPATAQAILKKYPKAQAKKVAQLLGEYVAKKVLKKVD